MQSYYYYFENQTIFVKQKRFQVIAIISSPIGLCTKLAPADDDTHLFVVSFFTKPKSQLDSIRV
jgi:hypothetical protein